MSAEGATAAPSAWLRSERFDYRSIASITLVAIGVGALAQLVPAALQALFIADVTFLGWQHVATSFTRVAHHPSERERRFILYVLPLLAIGAVTLGIALLGTSTLGAIYFYWQTFHYARQVWGIDRIYARKAGQRAPDRFTEALIYAIAAAAMAHRSLVSVVNFGGEEIHFMAIPRWLPLLFDASAILIGTAWVVRAIRNPEVAYVRPIRATFIATYALVFALGYGLFGDFLTGWVLVNVWHNLQYLMLVRIFNEDRFSGARSDAKGLVARLSQPAMWLPYFAIMTFIGVLLTLALQSLSLLSLPSVIPLTFAAAMSLNFHHYIVDGIIWRSPKPSHG